MSPVTDAELARYAGGPTALATESETGWAEDEDEWEYEYSTTETEVRSLLRSRTGA